MPRLVEKSVDGASRVHRLREVFGIGDFLVAINRESWDVLRGADSLRVDIGRAQTHWRGVHTIAGFIHGAEVVLVSDPGIIHLL